MRGGGLQLPFEIARVYYLYDVPSGSTRGGHSHIQLQQLIIAATESFSVHVDNGFIQQTITLNRPSIGLYLDSMVWREIDDFSAGGLCLVLASMRCDEADYIRDYDDFLSRAKRAR